MATKNPRLNVTFDQAMMSVLTSLAKQEHKSISSLTKELILEALDRREDKSLSSIAESRDNDSQKLVSHDKAWK